MLDRDPVMKIDRLTSGVVEFPTERQLVFLCETEMTRYQKLHIFGTKGCIGIKIPFNAPPAGRGESWWTTEPEAMTAAMK